MKRLFWLGLSLIAPSLLGFVLLIGSAYGQEQETEEQRAARLSEYQKNAAGLSEQARAYKATVSPEIETARTFATQGASQASAVLTCNGQDTLIWTTYEAIMTGCVSQNDIVRNMTVFAFMLDTNFRLVAPSRDQQNTVFATGNGFHGTLYRFQDPRGLGVADDNYTTTYDGIKDLDALLATSANQLLGNAAYGNKLLSAVVGNQGISIPPTPALPFIGNGSVSLAMNRRGDIASIDIRAGLIWIQRNGSSYPDIFYGKSDLQRAVALAFDKNDQLYVSIAGQEAINEIGFSRPYTPSRIVKLTDSGPGRDATSVEILSGGFLNFSYGPHSLAISEGRVYFTNNDFRGEREILMWDIPTRGLNLKVPPTLARGVSSFALLSGGSTPTPPPDVFPFPPPLPGTPR